MNKLLTKWNLSNLVKPYAATFKKFFIDLLAPVHYNLWLFVCCKTKLKKKCFFFKKYLSFLQNIHYLQKKIILYEKKKLYWFFFVYWKSFFYKKMKKIYISFDKCFFIQKIYIHSAKKKFLIIKNVFVKTSCWTQ